MKSWHTGPSAQRWSQTGKCLWSKLHTCFPLKIWTPVYPKVYLRQEEVIPGSSSTPAGEEKGDNAGRWRRTAGDVARPQTSRGRRRRPAGDAARPETPRRWRREAAWKEMAREDRARRRPRENKTAREDDRERRRPREKTTAREDDRASTQKETAQVETVRCCAVRD